MEQVAEIQMTFLQGVQGWFTYESSASRGLIEVDCGTHDVTGAVPGSCIEAGEDSVEVSLSMQGGERRVTRTWDPEKEARQNKTGGSGMRVRAFWTSSEQIIWYRENKIFALCCNTQRAH